MADRLEQTPVIRILGGLVSAVGATLVAVATFAGTTAAQEATPSAEHVVAPSALLRPSRPLNWLQAPLPPNVMEVVADKSAAIDLGKAFFWDTQVGSDGMQACATCHSVAGADGRTSNQVSPGLPAIHKAFSSLGAPNTTLTASDFPFYRLADPDNRNSAVLQDRREVVGSQGVANRRYVGPGQDGEVADQCTDVADPLFTVHGTNVRQVTPRQAPSIINAIFYGRNFWDGRAATYFNGVNSQGISDQAARVWKVVDGQIQPVKLVLPSAGMASQATGPALNEVEMACAGRTWPEVGRKLLGLVPLGKQLVDPTDGALGPLANSRIDPKQRGLNVGYADLIRQAFLPEYWSSTSPVSVGTPEYTQMEANFALFWGLSVELYESTLISDQTPYDQYLSGNDSALSPEQYAGLSIFNGKAGCMNCHAGAVLSNNVSTLSGALSGFSGFENTGVTPVEDDPGVGPIAAGVTGDTSLQGAFKTPQLRNVELTGPYFHNGSMATLREVVDFYNRGGNFDSPFLDSTLKRQATLPRSQQLNEDQKHSLISFLLALTDERVRYQRAPFDHPELCLPEGQLVADGGAVSDTLKCIPALGADGASQPLQPFLELDPYRPARG